MNHRTGTSSDFPTHVGDDSHFTDLLRFNTCGSVDDGKSTLIGRLLYDSKSLMDDQLAHLESAAPDASGMFNLANVTDGLRAEREQGITIDVAYRYFATKRRKFIVADTPGHVQYTRNMVSGASTADLSVVLVDARAGLVDQSRRHLAIASILGIPHVVVAVNKMDLVGWSEARFDEIRRAFDRLRGRLSVRDVTFIPMSALAGDNVVDESRHTPWFHGQPLLGHLETVPLGAPSMDGGFRFPVQWVNRPHHPRDPSLHDFRGFSGQIAGGVVRVGQSVTVLPSGITSKVRAIHTYDGELTEAFFPQSVTILLTDPVDVSRGDMIVGTDIPPKSSTEVAANICWLHGRSLEMSKRYLMKHTTQTLQVAVTELEYRVDIETLSPQMTPNTLEMNDIARARLRLAKPIFFDEYAANRRTGAFVLIEQGTNATVAAGMLTAG